MAETNDRTEKQTEDQTEKIVRAIPANWCLATKASEGRPSVYITGRPGRKPILKVSLPATIAGELGVGTTQRLAPLYYSETDANGGTKITIHMVADNGGYKFIQPDSPDEDGFPRRRLMYSNPRAGVAMDRDAAYRSLRKVKGANTLSAVASRVDVDVPVGEGKLQRYADILTFDVDIPATVNA